MESIPGKGWTAAAAAAALTSFQSTNWLISPQGFPTRPLAALDMCQDWLINGLEEPQGVPSGWWGCQLVDTPGLVPHDGPLLLINTVDKRDTFGQSFEAVQ